jgi:hypothetical protein
VELLQVLFVLALLNVSFVTGRLEYSVSCSADRPVGTDLASDTMSKFKRMPEPAACLRMLALLMHQSYHVRMLVLLHDFY